MKSYFSDDTTLYTSIDINLPGEKLTFATVQEVRDFKGLPPRISDFSVYLSPRLDQRGISLRSHQAFSGDAYVAVEGDNEAWCTAVCEECARFIGQHRAAHWWVRNKYFGRALLISLLVGPLVLIGRVREMLAPWVLDVWTMVNTLVVVLFLFVSIAKQRIAPSAAIIIDRDGSWLRRNSTEVIALLTLISAAAAVLALLRD